MGWLPTVRLEIVKLAVVLPPLVLKLPCPILAQPSEKITTPVGLATAVLPGPLTATVAVKATICPDTDAVTEDTTVLVLALLTVCCILPLLLAKLPSPLYLTVTVC